MRIKSGKFFSFFGRNFALGQNFSKNFEIFFSKSCSIFDETNDHIIFFEKFGKNFEIFFSLRLKFSPGHRKFSKIFQKLFLKFDPKPIYLGRIPPYKHHPRKIGNENSFFFVEITYSLILNTF